MKVNLFVRVVLVVIAICLVSISFAIWTQTVKATDHNELSALDINTIDYIPKEYGELKAVAIDSDFRHYLYFVTSDGTIYIARLRFDYISMFRAKIQRKEYPKKEIAPGTGF